MKITMDRTTIVRLYCYTYQAERSIAFGLGAEWSELRQYYSGERMDALRSLSQQARQMTAHYPGVRVPENREEAWRGIRAVGLFQVLFGNWVSRRKRSWSFDIRGVSFMAATLAKLVQMQDLPTRPPQDELIALRMDLCSCRSMIEAQCYGLVEIKKARWLEHFWQADWITPARMKDLLGETSLDEQRARRSA